MSFNTYIIGSTPPAYSGGAYRAPTYQTREAAASSSATVTVSSADPQSVYLKAEDPATLKIVLEAGDDISRLIIFAKFTGNRHELIYDGDRFCSGYSTSSTIVKVGTIVTIKIYRGVGWYESPTIYTHVSTENGGQNL